MDLDTKVTFTLSIGYAGARHVETFKLKDLGYDPEVDKDLDKFMSGQWVEWSNNYIDGSWAVEDE